MIMIEDELKKLTSFDNIKIFRRDKLYSQTDIDKKLYIPFHLVDTIEYPQIKKTEFHRFIRNYLDKHGIKSCVYFVISKLGNFKYIYNKRPNNKTFTNLIKFSPQHDGERDVEI
jgi:hypothetical protein